MVWHAGEEGGGVVFDTKSCGGGHDEAINTVDCTVSKNGKRVVATGGNDNCVCIWDYETRSCMHKLENAHTDLVQCVRLSPDGTSLLSCSEVGTHWGQRLAVSLSLMPLPQHILIRYRTGLQPTYFGLVPQRSRRCFAVTLPGCVQRFSCHPVGSRERQ